MTKARKGVRRPPSAPAHLRRPAARADLGPRQASTLSRLLFAAGVGLLAAVAYTPALRNGFVWDDRQLIVENEALVRPGAVARAFTQDFWESEEQIGASDYYRPLVTLSYIADRRAHGLNPRGYHATNLALHAGAAALLVLLAAELGLSLWLAGLGGALFAVHPALAESVAWISGRTDTLAAILVLLFLITDRRRQRWLWRALAAAAFGAALLAKEIAVGAPAIAVLGEATLDGRPALPALRRRWELGLVLAAYVALRVAVLERGIPTAGPGSGFGIDLRVAALPHLIGILAWPPLGRIEYGTGLPLAVLVPGALAGVALIATLAFGVWRERRSRPPRALTYLVGSGLLAMAPAAVSALVKGVVGDRLIYLAAAFLLPALAVVAVRWARHAGVAALAAAVAVGAVATAAKSAQWQSDRVLFEKALEAPHPSARAHLNLGIAYHDEGMLRESVAHLRRALDHTRFKSACYTLGLLYMEVGCEDLALRYYREALAADPAYAHAANNLGALLAEVGESAAAEKVLSGALAATRGKAVELRANLDLLRTGGGELGRTSRKPSACGSEEAAGRLLDDPRHLNRQALEQLRRGQLEQAGVLIRAALHHDPGLVASRLNLAQWHILRDEPRLAREVLADILRADPENDAARRLVAHLDALGKP